jgi:putative nucleotidyltransferase with HDIG domain
MLPPLPQVAMRVMRLASDPDANMEDLRKVVATDQSLAAQAMKVANSAMFGMAREVRTLDRAIMILGFTAVRSIAIAAGAKGLYLAMPPGFPVMAIWRHSVASGAAALACAKASRYRMVDEAFLAGLLHDIGKSVLAMRRPAEYMTLLAAQKEGVQATPAVERAAIGLDHCMVGKALANAWGMPDAIADAIRWHHEPMKVASEDDRKLVACVTIGDLIATEFNWGIGSTEALGDSYAEACYILGLDEERITDIRTQSADAINEAIATIS